MTKKLFFSTFLRLGKIFSSGHRIIVHFWSLDQLVVETLGVAFVRTYVHPFVRNAFSRKLFIIFSETLELVRACKREKNVPSAFLIIFTVLAILAKNWSKWPFGWMCTRVSLRAGNP